MPNWQPNKAIIELEELEENGIRDIKQIQIIIYIEFDEIYSAKYGKFKLKNKSVPPYYYAYTQKHLVSSC